MELLLQTSILPRAIRNKGIHLLQVLMVNTKGILLKITLNRGILLKDILNSSRSVKAILPNTNLTALLHQLDTLLLNLLNLNILVPKPKVPIMAVHRPFQQLPLLAMDLSYTLCQVMNFKKLLKLFMKPCTDLARTKLP